MSDVEGTPVAMQQPATGKPSQRVGIIIPARNEAEALGHVLAEIPRGWVQELIVVDNGSTDRTAAVAQAGGARVVHEPTPGYGRACQTGLAALSTSTQVIVFLDADHSDYPEEIPQLVTPITDGLADLVIGSRVHRAAAGSLTPPQRVGNRIACIFMRACFGVSYTDLGPFRAIRSDALKWLRMRDQRYGWTVEMQAKAAQARMRVMEVPVRYRPRIGRSKISGTLSGSVQAGAAILSTLVKIALLHPAPAWNQEEHAAPVSFSEVSNARAGQDPARGSARA